MVVLQVIHQCSFLYKFHRFWWSQSFNKQPHLCAIGNIAIIPSLQYIFNSSNKRNDVFSQNHLYYSKELFKQTICKTQWFGKKLTSQNDPTWKSSICLTRLYHWNAKSFKVVGNFILKNSLALALFAMHVAMNLARWLLKSKI